VSGQPAVPLPDGQSRPSGSASAPIQHASGDVSDQPAPARCQRCGQTDVSVATHSGVEECSGCWHHRKLDAPAASHWAKVSKEFLSNVDMHDMMTYLPRALEDAVDGNGEPLNLTWGQLLRGVQAVMLHSERVLKDGPYHLWEEEEK
jgi:hypothetical protein